VDAAVICCALLDHAYHSHSGMCCKRNGSRLRWMDTENEELDRDALV
jgi:Fe-S-cluster containining protein